MNFFTHTVAERSINKLMTLYQSLTSKSGRDNQCTEMLAIAFDLEVRALESAGDVILDEFRCGQHDFAFAQKCIGWSQ